MAEAATFAVLRAVPDERPALSRMLELYQHDLSNIWDQDLDEGGEYGYDLARYWSDPNCHPYVVRCDGRLAGFALVDSATKVPGGDFWMDQFFILKKYRRRGIGQRTAHAVFDLHRGRWQVGQMAENSAAQVFWRAAITAYTGGAFREHRLASGWWQGLVQEFRS
ncbi:GNAT family N-acetyltransferase [Ramlibacter sp. MMS24-I3-19]|uniref:GNAT family N-acetyltransferase n=1 Tax=Ramlibacter sp. MMS24-I3-19 TaxID=3416606 RepID=UPI003CFDC5FC